MGSRLRYACFLKAVLAVKFVTHYSKHKIINTNTDYRVPKCECATDTTNFTIKTINNVGCI